MAVNREFRCTVHNHEFESTDEHPECPGGCDPCFVVLEFRTPPSIKSNTTSHTDLLRKQLASDYNLTDVRNDKEGTSVMSNTSVRSGGAKQDAEKPSSYWGNTQTMFGANPGWRDRQEGATSYNVANLRKPLWNVGTERAPKYVERYVPIKDIQQGARRHLRAATVMMRPKGSSK